MALHSIFLFAPAETAIASKGPAAFAIALAKAHGANLTIFSVATDVTTPGKNVDAGAIAASLKSAADASGVRCTLVTEHSHAIGVHEAVAEHARLHDLSITGCNIAGLLSEKIIAEYLMFESGRPVIVVPADYDAPYQKGPLAIAWDNSSAAARALGDAIALFTPDQVQLLSIEGEKPLPTDLDTAQLVEVIGRRSTNASHRFAPLSGRSIGAALQEEAKANGCGLLVMGAFGHTRLRRFVLGSATSDILKNNQMPTLLSH